MTGPFVLRESHPGLLPGLPRPAKNGANLPGLPGEPGDGPRLLRSGGEDSGVQGDA